MSNNKFSSNSRQGQGQGRGRAGGWRRDQGGAAGSPYGHGSPRGNNSGGSGPPRRVPGDAPSFRLAHGAQSYGGGETRGRPGGVIFMQDRPASVDARIQDDSDKAIVVDLNRSDTNAGKEAGTQHDLPLRPDFGTEGRPISLRANYFPVEVKGQVFLYSAEIILPNCKELKRRIKQRVFRLAEQTVHWQQAGMLGTVAHDCAEKLVAFFELPQHLTIRGVYYEEHEVAPAENATQYELTLNFVEEVDQGLLKQCLAGTPVDSQVLAKVLSALNLVLTTYPSSTGAKIGKDDEKKKHPDQRLFFDNPVPRDIGGGLAVREGFYLSVRPAHQQLMVNVNTCHAAFYKPQNFMEAMNEYRRFVGHNAPLGTFGCQVRAQVKTSLNHHVVMIQGVSKQNAHQHKFKHGDFGWISVAEYYKQEHHIELEHPNLPLLEGSKGNCYPQEVCDIIKDQGFKGRLANKKHASNMLDVACRPPMENAKEIVNRGLDVLGFQNSNLVLDSFGIHVGTDMAVVPGRILDKPGLSYSSNKRANIDSGRASWNLRDVEFAVGARLDKWAVLVIQDGGREDFRGSNDQALRRIANGFCAMCNKSGMQVGALRDTAFAEVRLTPRDNDNFRDQAITEIERELTTLKNRVAPDLVLVMLSNDDKAIYNGVKWLCDVKLDIASVCMQSSKVQQEIGRQQYYANVVLKVNMKMGGINHKLDANSGLWLKKASTMIMGMDVTHPAKGLSVEGTPSVVAVVASVDEHFAQYPAALDIRSSKVEIERGEGQVDEDSALTKMFISRFELYQARNKGKLPERVILFRDGVSESQFTQVRQYELKELKRAVKHFGSYEPKLSIIVCGKRHHTRFYPTREGDAARDGNPLPGTIVDRGVTPAYEFDFFLQAHAGLKGTARPTHYFVVHDENGFKADELQRVTNELSYMFARATKAVSLVSPAYWADIACERGRCYLHKLLEGGKDKDKSSDAPGKGKGRDTGKKGKKREEDTDAVFEKAKDMWAGGVSGQRLRDTMFYL